MQMVIINKDDAADDQQNLIDKCAFSMLQDTEEDGVWNLMGGGKDDFYIYDATGALVEYLPYNSGKETNLSKEEGYATLKHAIKKAFGE